MSFFGNTEGVDRSKYEHLTMSIKQTVLEKAHHRCHGCNMRFNGVTQSFFEHINGSKKDNRPENLRALCSKCFKKVEKKENKKSVLDSLFSKMKL
jgi:5-methylcytosine-specific restriction endonuclease McrA